MAILLELDRKSVCGMGANQAAITMNRMAWQWAETLVEIRVTLADIRGTTK